MVIKTEVARAREIQFTPGLDAGLIAHHGQVNLLLGCSSDNGDGVVHIRVRFAPAHHHRLAGLAGAYQGGVASLPKLVCESPEMRENYFLTLMKLIRVLHTG